MTTAIDGLSRLFPFTIVKPNQRHKSLYVDPSFPSSGSIKTVHLKVWEFRRIQDCQRFIAVTLQSPHLLRWQRRSCGISYISYCRCYLKIVTIDPEYFILYGGVKCGSILRDSSHWFSHFLNITICTPNIFTNQHTHRTGPTTRRQLLLISIFRFCIMHWR